MTTTTTARRWDEPAGATTPRGWLHIGELVTGFYLDYGPDHYRSPHSSTVGTVNGPREVTWCKPGAECPTCQPGNILAVRYPDGPSSPDHRSRYVETIAQARAWVETGHIPETVTRAA